ncbi:hypothetical protein ACFVTP_33005 [Streptomyces celluloflavus]|uniref:hypothetical protein n=1 Tax=Streptomyces celluloflavus TaxID=58344 RepID=UPI0036DB8C01
MTDQTADDEIVLVPVSGRPLVAEPEGAQITVLLPRLTTTADVEALPARYGALNNRPRPRR